MTPNLDRLIQDSLTLRKASVQLALCAPSRASVLTGRRPDTLKVWDLNTWFTEAGCANCYTVGFLQTSLHMCSLLLYFKIPRLFKEAGYRTFGIGKIFHPVNMTKYPADVREEKVVSKGLPSEGWSEHFYWPRDPYGDANTGARTFIHSLVSMVLLLVLHHIRAGGCMSHCSEKGLTVDFVLF